MCTPYPPIGSSKLVVMSLAEVLATRIKVSDKIDGKALVTAIQRTKWFYSIIYMAFALQRSI